MQENCLEGSGDITQRLDRGHRKSGARRQSFVASKRRHKLDQISSLLKILQWPPTVLMSDLVTPHICDLKSSYVKNLILYHPFNKLSDILVFFQFFSHTIFFPVSKCLHKLCLMPEWFFGFSCFFLLLFLGLALFHP